MAARTCRPRRPAAAPPLSFTGWYRVLPIRPWTRWHSGASQGALERGLRAFCRGSGAELMVLPRGEQP